MRMRRAHGCGGVRACVRGRESMVCERDGSCSGRSACRVCKCGTGTANEMCTPEHRECRSNGGAVWRCSRVVTHVAAVRGRGDE